MGVRGLNKDAGGHDLRTIKGLIVDMDGVLWRGNKPCKGVRAFFGALKEKSIRYVVATNNPLYPPNGFARKAKEMGIHLLPSQIVTPLTVTVEYIKEHYPKGARVYVVSEPALKQEVEKAGFQLADENVAVVVVSMDRSLTYETLKTASLLIREGALFIGTNPDPFYPDEEGLLPSAGAIVVTIAASTEREPLIMGKPERYLYNAALDYLELPRSQVAVIGDSLTSDIQGGNKMGMSTILVLTGITDQEMLQKSKIRPDYVYPSLLELTRDLA